MEVTFLCRSEMAWLMEARENLMDWVLEGGSWLAVGSSPQPASFWNSGSEMRGLRSRTIFSLASEVWDDLSSWECISDISAVASLRILSRLASSWAVGTLDMMLV